MQLKTFLITSILFASYTTCIGQDLDGSFYKDRKQVIVVRKGMDPKLYAAKLAANTPTQQYKGIPLAIDTTYFGSKVDYISNYTQKYLKSHNRTLTTVQERAEKVFPLIDSILGTYNVPKELKYLAVIESALNNHARSRVGAVGPWQFMSYTGREMGLVIRGNRDDRKNWSRSTNAAAKYLIKLYEELDDWLLVIAAYNSGPGPVRKAIRRTGSTNFWDIKRYLPRETQGHVLAFVATSTIFEKLDHYIGSSIPAELSYVKPPTKESLIQERIAKSPFSEEELRNMAIVRISTPIHLEVLAKELGVDSKLLKDWNEDYDLFEYNTYPSDQYGLRIPKDKLSKFLERKNFLEKRSEDVYAELDM